MVRGINGAKTFYNFGCSLRFRSDGKASGAVVGIDLGTTNSCVSVMEGKQVSKLITFFV
jgi:Hsp70 protein